MTISTTINRVSYAGNGVTTSFAFSYLFLAEGDLVVLLVNDATGVSVTQVLTTHYTTTGVTLPAGGTVEMITPPASGETLVIYRDPAHTQLLDIITNGAFPADSAEQALDLLTMANQRQQDLIDRSFVLSDSDTSGASPVIPTPAALNIIRWNAAGTALENTPDPATNGVLPSITDTGTSSTITLTPTAFTFTLPTTFSSTLNVTGAFTSVGIDDNATSVAITIDASEQVGIGTVPSQDLHVQGTGGGKLRLGETSARYAEVQGSASGAGSEAVLVLHTTNSAGTLTQALLIDGTQNADFSGNVSLVDSKHLYLGTGDDLDFYHDDTNTRMYNNTGQLIIKNLAASQVVEIQVSDSGGSEQNGLHIGGANTTVKSFYDGTQSYSSQSGGIAFGTDTASANTLDDYEEGTWTPVLSDGTNNATTSIQSGFYTKIGRLVTITCRIRTSSLGSVSGAIRITGLPFSSSSVTHSQSALAVSDGVGLAITAGVNVGAYVEINDSYIKLKLWDQTTGESNMTEAHWSADGRLVVSGSYHI